MEMLDSMFSLFLEEIDSIFFILVGTCGAASNGLIGAAYVSAATRSPFSFCEFTRASLTMVGYEVSYTLLLTGMPLAGVATLVALGVTQFLVYRANPHWAQIASQLLNSHLPDSEGPKAVGRWLIIMAFVPVFLLLATTLREEALWIKLLVTALTPVSTYFGISLLALAAQQAR